MSSVPFFNFSSYKEFGIRNDAERYSFVLFLSFVLLSSLIGDSVILISSFKKGAFKLNEFFVSVIQHLAFADLLGVAFFLGPQITSLASNEWVLGNILCQVTPPMTHYLGCVNRVQNMAMSTSRALMLKYPNSRISRAMTKTAGHVIGLLIWLSVIPLPIIIAILEYNKAYFDFRTGLCEVSFLGPVWEYLLPPSIGLLVLGPIFVNIIATCFLFSKVTEARQIAKQTGATRSWQGFITVSMTGTVFCLANLPFTVYLLMSYRVTDFHGFFHNEFYRFSWAMLSISIMSNFFIYLGTVKSFRNFIVKGIEKFTNSAVQWAVDIHGRIQRSTNTGKKQLINQIVLNNCKSGHTLLYLFKVSVNQEIQESADTGPAANMNHRE